MLRFAACLVCPLILAACAADAPVTADAAVRDSAGIRIVENGAPAGTVRLGAEPVVVIGSVTGDEAYLFEQPRSPRLLADGGVAVGESRLHEIRFFAASGTHRFTVGGSGSGPGEFRTFSTLALLPGDTLVIGDSSTDRITWIGPDGTFIRAVADERSFFHPLPDGRLLRSEDVSDGSGGSMGPARDSMALIAYRPGEPVEDSLATVLGDDYFVTMMRMGGSEAPRGLGLPYGRTRTTATIGDRIFTGDGERFEILVLDPDGRLREVWRRAWAPVPLTDAHVQAQLDMLSGSSPGLSQLLMEPLADAPYRDHLAAYDRFVPTREGGLWARHQGMVGDSVVNWSVFSREGQWLGEVQTPPRFELEDVRGRRVLGVTRDEYDVPFLHVHEVSLPRAGA
ncbi:MAG: hypothetical protein WEB88_13040 [Gemmatimonadota bacterium]